MRIFDWFRKKPLPPEPPPPEPISWVPRVSDYCEAYLCHCGHASSGAWVICPKCGCKELVQTVGRWEWEVRPLRGLDDFFSNEGPLWTRSWCRNTHFVKREECPFKLEEKV